MTGGADPLQAVADGLQRRVRELAQAEEQLARFAFTEDAADLDQRQAEPPWRHFASRLLAVAGDPDAMGLLRRLHEEGPAAVAVLGDWLEADRLAVVDRLNHLTHVGCVVRDLETDRVTLSALGHALITLVDEISRRAGSVAAGS